MIKVILWDLDGTLLNFSASESNAIKAAFEHFNLGTCTDEMVARYSAINLKHWKMLERGEITKDQVKVLRFVEFFEKEGITSVSPEDFWHFYEEALPDTVEFIGDSYSIVKALSADCRQYIVTNGTKSVQTVRLEKSGFDKLFDGVFISDEVGFEKPDIRFFEVALSAASDCANDEIMIVGDSLSSDIKGGANAGIVTCWYNPAGNEPDASERIDYEIKTLDEVLSIVKA